jgi:DNA polymerase-4
MRKVIHIDMDAFYASVEQRDDPGLRGIPVAVGSSGARGVVMTASYEARRFGVGSAMPAKLALQRCPQLIFVPPRMAVYRRVSQQIRQIFWRYTDLVEPLSLDEAYLDVTSAKCGPSSATLLAQKLKADIYETTHLTASAGVATNKFLAKLASAQNKPDGLTVIRPEQVQAFIDALPIEAFFGVGKVTARKLRELGVTTGLELRGVKQSLLIERFGKQGDYLWHCARGEDNRAVNPHRQRKSISSETTFAVDISSQERLIAQLPELVEQVKAHLEKQGFQAQGLFIKVKYRNHQVITRRQKLIVPTDDAGQLTDLAAHLIETRVDLFTSVRLLGVGVFDLQPRATLQMQLPLFDALPG